jgi:hypothetical protein
MSTPGGLLDKLERAMRIRAIIDDMKARQEARDQDRELKRAVLQDRQYNQAQEDFKTMLGLSAIGVLPTRGGDAGKLQAAFSGRRTVESPWGAQYSLPTDEQTFERKRRQAVEAGTMEGLKKNAIDAETDAYTDVTVPPGFGGSPGFGAKVPVQKSKVPDFLLKIESTLQKRNPNLHITYADDANGDRTYIGTNPANGAVKVLQKLPGVAKPQRTAQGAESIPDFDANVKKLMDQWREGHYNQVGITPEVVEAASIGEPEAATRIERANNTLYQRAVDSVKNQAKGSRTQSKTTSGGPVMPRANVAKAAQRKGMSEAEFLDWFKRMGGTVAP